MGLLLLVPGLILRFNDTTWFSGENKVGNILIIVGAVLIIIQIIATLVGVSVFNKARKDFNSRF